MPHQGAISIYPALRGLRFPVFDEFGELRYLGLLLVPRQPRLALGGQGSRDLHVARGLVKRPFRGLNLADTGNHRRQQRFLQSLFIVG